MMVQALPFKLFTMFLQDFGEMNEEDRNPRNVKEFVAGFIERLGRYEGDLK